MRKKLFCLTILILALGSARPVHADIVTVLFTGFNPDSPSGMDFLNDTLVASFAADFPDSTFSSDVFGYNQRDEAFDFINSHDEIEHLFLVGHSWGGNALIRLATNQLLPAGIDVDGTFQIDSVDIFNLFDPGIDDDVLPSNVETGYNYYQEATELLEPEGEQNVQGAININVEDFFNDPSITHTSIDNDTRVHDLIYLNMQLAIVPEPRAMLVLLFGFVGLAIAVMRNRGRVVAPTGQFARHIS